MKITLFIDHCVADSVAAALFLRTFSEMLESPEEGLALKRSEINAIIRDAAAFFRLSGFYLPPFATWTLEDWHAKGEDAREIIERRLGWDVTDFGQGDYDAVGLCVFTHSQWESPENLITHRGKTYAEKIMIVEPGQVTPLHFHRIKMEDIINRGGGKLVVQLYNATPDEELDSSERG